MSKRKGKDSKSSADPPKPWPDTDTGKIQGSQENKSKSVQRGQNKKGSGKNKK